MGIFYNDVGNGWTEEDNRDYINQWYADPRNQMNHGEYISHVGCAPQHTTWLEKNGGFKNGGSTIHSCMGGSLNYEAYHTGKGSQRFNSVEECKRYCGG